MPRRVDSNRGSFDGSVKTAVRRPTDRTSDRAENIMSNSAYIFDAIRTPRGKGKKDGALHEVKPVLLAAGRVGAGQPGHDRASAPFAWRAQVRCRPARAHALARRSHPGATG